MMKAGKWIWDNNFHYYICSECGVSSSKILDVCPYCNKIMIDEDDNQYPKEIELTYYITSDKSIFVYENEAFEHEIEYQNNYQKDNFRLFGIDGDELELGDFDSAYYLITKNNEGNNLIHWYCHYIGYDSPFDRSSFSVKGGGVKLIYDPDSGEWYSWENEKKRYELMQKIFKG